MLTTILIVFALIVISALLYLASLDGHYQIHRSKLINTDLNTAFGKLCDFKSWPDWSPWLMHEPETKFAGETVLEPMHALCEGLSGSVSDMTTDMQTGFPKLVSYIEATDGQITDQPFTAYHKVNLKTMRVVCDLAIPVTKKGGRIYYYPSLSFFGRP